MRNKIDIKPISIAELTSSIGVTIEEKQKYHCDIFLQELSDLCNDHVNYIRSYFSKEISLFDFKFNYKTSFELVSIMVVDLINSMKESGVSTNIGHYMFLCVSNFYIKKGINKDLQEKTLDNLDIMNSFLSKEKTSSNDVVDECNFYYHAFVSHCNVNKSENVCNYKKLNSNQLELMIPIVKRIRVEYPKIYQEFILKVSNKNI